MRSIRTPRALMAMALIGAIMAAAPASATTTAADSNTAFAVMRDANGAVLGTVVIQALGGKLIVAGRLTGLTAGFHGFHIHTTGQCVAPFTTAGGHLNPGATNHGHHAGDLPLLKVSADGVAVTVTETDSVALAHIFDADGSAIIIHALPDNYANVPTRYETGGVAGPDAATLATGDSGGRVACGVIVR